MTRPREYETCTCERLLREECPPFGGVRRDRNCPHHGAGAMSEERRHETWCRARGTHPSKPVTCTCERRGERREPLCSICRRDYPVWFAPNDLWNSVVRLPDGSERWPFLCPTCFGMKAVEAGVDEVFVFQVAESRVYATSDSLASRAPGAETPVDVVAAVRRDPEGRVWLCKRNATGAHGGLAGMWEYPGGKVEPDEQLRDALVREMREEFQGMGEVTVGRVLDSIDATLKGTGVGDDKIEQRVYRVTFFEVAFTREPTEHPGHSEVRWMTPAEACSTDHLPSGTIFNARHLAPGAERGSEVEYAKGVLMAIRAIANSAPTWVDPIPALSEINKTAERALARLRTHERLREALEEIAAIDYTKAAINCAAANAVGIARQALQKAHESPPNEGGEDDG